MLKEESLNYIFSLNMSVFLVDSGDLSKGKYRGIPLDLDSFLEC